jgi:heme exporter protein C
MKFDEPSMTTDMLIPFLLTMFGFMVFFYWLLLKRLQAEIVDREQGTRWLRELVTEGNP